MSKKRSDKDLSRLASNRIRELKKAGVDSNAMRRLEQGLNLFYVKHDRVKSGKWGTLISDNMSKREKQEMRGILNAFINDPTSTKRGIRSEFFDLVKAREKITGNKARRYKSIVTMSKVVDKASNILEAARIQSQVPSDVIKEMWQQQKANGWDVDDVKRELLSMADSGLDKRDVESYNDLLNSALRKLHRANR